MAMRCGASFPDSTATDTRRTARSSHSYKLNDTFTRLESTLNVFLQPSYESVETRSSTPGDAASVSCITAGSKIRPAPATLGTPASVGPSQRTLQSPSRSPYSSTPPRTSPVSPHRHRP
ncbi:hypothetical protein BDZ89DRAFT_1070177 [Hymenopellis radicata]|nr:hypothetical protein BDZ89DRAFT_1070177 [Hymenopellis radicata]